MSVFVWVSLVSAAASSSAEPFFGGLANTVCDVKNRGQRQTASSTQPSSFELDGTRVRPHQIRIQHSPARPNINFEGMKSCNSSFPDDNLSPAVPPRLVQSSLPQIGTASDAVSILQGKGEPVISILAKAAEWDQDRYVSIRRPRVTPRRKSGRLITIRSTPPLKGFQVCEHLSQMANVWIALTAVRHGEITTSFDEHGGRTNRKCNTGRAIRGTITYPSLGSLVAHEARVGPTKNAPPYVLIAIPMSSWPGFSRLKVMVTCKFDRKTGRGPQVYRVPMGLPPTVKVDASGSWLRSKQSRNNQISEVPGL